jgi:hypothetical protein
MDFHGIIGSIFNPDDLRLFASDSRFLRLAKRDLSGSLKLKKRCRASLATALQRKRGRALCPASGVCSLFG